MVRAEDAPADSATEARQQYNLGTAAFRDKKFVEAALHFEAAAAQRAHAVTLYTAALAWEQANKPERAADDYVRALEVPGLSAQQATNARERVATLEKAMGTVIVMAPDGWRVQLEGQSEVLVPARLHGVPGVHRLLIRAPGRLVDRRDVTLEVGQFTRLEIEDTIPPATPPAPVRPSGDAPPPLNIVLQNSDARPGTSLRKSLGFTAVGVGVATLGAGAILGIQARDAGNAYDASPSRATLDHANGLATWTTIALIAGAVFTAGGVTLILLPEGKSKATTGLVVRPMPSGASLGGVF